MITPYNFMQKNEQTLFSKINEKLARVPVFVKLVAEIYAPCLWLVLFAFSLRAIS